MAAVDLIVRLEGVSVEVVICVRQYDVCLQVMKSTPVAGQ